MSECKRWVEQGLDHFTCNSLMFPENRLVDTVESIPPYMPVAVIAGCIIMALAFIGYVMNVFKMIRRGDADSRLTIRTIGIFIPPIGAVVGWI